MAIDLLNRRRYLGKELVDESHEALVSAVAMLPTHHDELFAKEVLPKPIQLIHSMRE